MPEYDFTDMTPENVDDRQHGLSNMTIRFLTWFSMHVSTFEALGYKVNTDYHGSDDEPIILGKYVDDLFNIPDFGADRMDFANLDKLKMLSCEFTNLFNTLDDDIKKELMDSKMLGVWFNNHSS